MPSCFSRFLCLRVLVLVRALFSQPLAAEALQGEILQLFPKATRIEPKQAAPPVYSVYQLDELLGYAFESSDYSSLQGFSGKPIRLLIGMDPPRDRSVALKPWAVPCSYEFNIINQLVRVEWQQA